MDKPQMNENLKRVYVEHGRVFIDGVAIGNRFHDLAEAHVIRHWVTMNLHDIEHVLIGRHVSAVMEKTEGKD